LVAGKLEAKEMLVNREESPQRPLHYYPGARAGRFVGRFFIAQDFAGQKQIHRILSSLHKVA
jgi:hypothetical protein